MSDQMFGVAKKRVLVTGGSRGIGRAFALFLREAGAEVAVFYRQTQPDETLTCRGVRGIPCDLGDPGSRRQAFSLAAEHLCGLDVLVNCAGIDKKAPSVDMPIEEFEAVVDVNLNAVFDLSRMAAKRMAAEGTGGKIVNIASVRSYRAGTSAVYSATKAAVVQLTKNLAKEWAADHINVNAIAPGYYLTEMTREALLGRRGPEILGQIPMGRIGEMEDLRGTLLFLCSRASDYITGAVIPVDGGYLC